MQIAERLVKEFNAGAGQIQATLALLDEGATVPFIARYRKERTGNLDETKLRDIAHRYAYYKELEARKETILASIREQGKLTPELEARIGETADKTELEDLYLPFKPKRTTRASKAREAGLEPLARWLADLSEPEADLNAEAEKYLNPEKGLETAEAALAGACDILAEEWSDDADARKELRTLAAEEGILVSAVRKGFADKKTKYEMYRDYREKVSTLASHRVLAMMRGEREKVLALKLDLPQEKAVRALVYRFVRHPHAASAPRLVETAIDALGRLLAPAVETEVRQGLIEKAEKEAFQVFGANLKDLLLSPPAGRQPALGVDPGFRTGCKLAVVDATGKFLENAAIYPNEPRNDTDGAKLTLLKMIAEYAIAYIAVGNGTAGRETVQFIRESLDELPAGRRPAVVVVNEAGASVYSASEAAVREFPRLDITIRGAISIARRLQDPLAEMVKIEPRSIGVGQYQHDVEQTGLKTALDEVVESCVNSVGVDLNLASEELLRHVSGLNKATAEAVVRRRNERGPYAARAELMEVKGLGEKTFEQAAGFLRIPGAANPLDGSAVHPERYGLVERMAESLSASVGDLIGNTALLRKISPKSFVTEDAGLPTIVDIVRELEKPGRDPRAAFNYASFPEGVKDIKDLTEGMILEGVVSNVANFGAFVDIGVHQDGLVHVSELAEKFVRDPRQAVKVGQVVKVKVLSVDLVLKRISLSLKQAAASK
ncbi:MAG: Tex family protein [Candidatus Aminicenantes bacterium]|nr:Tex family protein [Candidatus Aminicenantes bacterium]